jgi:hypothetical protein
LPYGQLRRGQRALVVEQQVEEQGHGDEVGQRGPGHEKHEREREDGVDETLFVLVQAGGREPEGLVDEERETDGDCHQERNDDPHLEELQGLVDGERCRGRHNVPQDGLD